MKTKTYDYSYTHLVEGFKGLGFKTGDTVFVHASLGMLGLPEGCSKFEDICELFLKALRSVVGEQGTILVPTYTFSFCKSEVFDVLNTSSTAGPFSEYFRKLPGAVRSEDPIFSVSGLGARARELLEGLPHTCFGPGSVYDRMASAGGKICTAGVGLDYATFRHHIEELAKVPFRYKKLFSGFIKKEGERRKEAWVYNVRILADNGYPHGVRMAKKARETGICKIAEIGRGEAFSIDCATLKEFLLDEFKKDPWFTARGPAADPVGLERGRGGAGSIKVSVRLPENASVRQIVDKLGPLPRDIVSDGFDAALEALASEAPMSIHEYPTGTECWSWIIPEKWTCREAYLETTGGRRLFSYEDNPLHVMSYSLPFEGEVSRQELFDHLFVHPKLNDEVPFKFKYYERDWGLCCSRKLKESLTEERYRVVIRTEHRFDTLKVGEVIARGKSEESIVLCAHLCHPAQANDGLSGVAAGIEVMRELVSRKDLRYTYRLLILPETIGSVAYLSNNEGLIPKMKGGLFLEALGLEYPHALQLSFAGNTELDRCFSLILKERDPEAWTGPFRSVIGNDERQFNSPGVRVPMLSLSRVLPPSSPDYPYVGYHSSMDSADRAIAEKIEDSCRLVLDMIGALEGNLTPVNRFKGEVFCSRYGLHIDWYSNPEDHKKFFDIMYLVDGTRTIADIAEYCGTGFSFARNVIEKLRHNGLIEYREVAEKS